MGKGRNKCGQGLGIESGKRFKNVGGAAKGF